MNNKNKILTLTGQKHDYKHLSQIISESSPEELSSILSVLGIDRVVDPDGNIIPVYSLDIESDKPTFITKGFDRVLTGKVYNYFQDVTEKVSSFQWRRDSGDPTRDKAWEEGKVDSTLTLTEEDFTQAIYTKDVIFTLEVVIAGKTLTDSITFSTFQTLSKVQIESSATLFIENSPNNITFTYTSEAEISSQKWYVNGNMRGVGKSLVLGYNDVERGKSAVVKLEALEKGTGNVLTDIVSIPRVKNGTDGEPGVPGIPGTSTYTWIKYADTETGEGMSDYPFNRDGSAKEYIGVKANQPSPIESENPSDYEWVKYIGDKGIPGDTGYMWVKYSMFPNGRDTNGSVDMYDTPFIIQGPGDREDMSYMGIAYNKDTEVESNIPEDYQWSKIRGEDGRTSYLLELSNDNTSVVSDSSGNFPNPAIAFANAKTEATLYYGNEPLERSEYGIVLSSSQGLTYSHSDSNHSVQITGLTTQTGTVTFKAFVKNDNGELDLSKKIAENTFSVTKIANTTVYEILPSTNVIKVNTVYGNSNLAELEPGVISVKIMANTGETNSETTVGKLTYRYIYSSTTTDEDGTLIPISGNSITLNNNGEPLFIEFKYFHPNTNLLVDRERIPFVRDGVSAKYEETRYTKTSGDNIIPSVSKTNPNPGNHWTVAPPQFSSPEALWMIKATKKASDDSLIGEWSDPVKISGYKGDKGDAGIVGTVGPSPRTFEWVPGHTYQNGGGFIDYIYYRGTGDSDTCRGWYIVKPQGKTPQELQETPQKAVANASGCPDNKFDKLPFENNATFGTVIAEQANIAGFIFRNQVLTSQQNSYQYCGGVQKGPYPNLTIDGIQGVIKFLERLVLNKDGIFFKDDCGNVRIKFVLDSLGIPILQFLNEDGTIKWEAGKDGYKIIVTGTRPPKWSYSGRIKKVDVLNSYDGSNEEVVKNMVRQDVETGFMTIKKELFGSTFLNSIYTRTRINCSGQPVSMNDPIHLIFSQTAFPDTVYFYEKGDMAENMNNMEDLWYKTTQAISQEAYDTNNYPLNTFYEDGWYMGNIGGSVDNRDHTTICFANKGVYPLSGNSAQVNVDSNIGYKFIPIFYIKKGKVVRELQIIEIGEESGGFFEGT